MKNIYLGAFLAASLLATFSSCKKELQTPVEPGSATIQGRIWANLNETNDTLSDGSSAIGTAAEISKREFAPQGTVVTFTIKGADLDQTPQAGYPYKDVVRTATVDASGNYTVSVPAYEMPIDVTISFNEFEAQSTQWGRDPQDTLVGGATATRQYRERYYRNDATVTVFDGANLVRDYSYDKQ
jgi:hypothetical protein